MRSWKAFALVVVLIGAGLHGARAEDETVKVVGCVTRGVEMGCLIIKDRKTGKTYEINDANPPPDPAQNLVVVLKGQVFRGLSYCMQGTILKQITWTYTKRLCTPAR